MKLINSYSSTMLAIWLLLFGSLGIASEPMSKPLIDFYDASAANQWLSVNDNVMGGVSEGGFCPQKNYLIHTFQSYHIYLIR